MFPCVDMKLKMPTKTQLRKWREMSDKNNTDEVWHEVAKWYAKCTKDDDFVKMYGSLNTAHNMLMGDYEFGLIHSLITQKLSDNIQALSNRIFAKLITAL